MCRNKLGLGIAKIVGVVVAFGIFPLSVHAEQPVQEPQQEVQETEKSWLRSWGEKIGQKAREARDQVDPDGSLQEKTTTSYEDSKSWLKEQYGAAKNYVDENKGDWKKEGAELYGLSKEQAKEAWKEFRQGAKEGFATDPKPVEQLPQPQTTEPGTPVKPPAKPAQLQVL